jgi:hypothetical protein
MSDAFVQRADGAGGGQPSEPSAGGSTHAADPPGSVDPRILADRVYRLLQEELAIARERE